MSDIEHTAREQFSAVLTHPVVPAALDLDADMVGVYALTSLNKVLFLTELCEAAKVDLGHFTEDDLARMRTLRDVTEAFTRYAPEGA